MKLNPSINEFPAAMVSGCNAALDAGIRYNDEFDDFVFKHMGGFGTDAVLMEVASLDDADPDHWQARRELSKRLEVAVVAAPRGHYVVIRNTSESHGIIYKTIVSDGRGDRPAVGGNYDSYDAMPTAEKVLERMVGYEIYLCRKALEKARYHSLCVAAMKEYGLHVGYTSKGEFEVGGDKFSTVTITELDWDIGQIKIHMAKRGSRNRFETWIGAEAFVSKAKLDQKRKAAETANCEDLFGLAA